MSFQTYTLETRRLIRDTQGLFVSSDALAEYINQGREQVALQTDCLQRLIAGTPPWGATAVPGNVPTPAVPSPQQQPAMPGGMMPGGLPNQFLTMPRVERYPYQGFGNEYLNAQHRGLRGIKDCIQIAVSWGGAFRPALTWLPWEEFQAQLRATQVLITNYPFLWSVLNDGEQGEVYVYPPPQSAQEMEWLVSATPAAIFSDDDFDVIPQPFQRAVSYYAACRAYEDQQRFANAELMRGRFNEMLGITRGAVDRGKVPSYYPIAP